MQKINNKNIEKNKAVLEDQNKCGNGKLSEMNQTIT